MPHYVTWQNVEHNTVLQNCFPIHHISEKTDWCLANPLAVVWNSGCFLRYNGFLKQVICCVNFGFTLMLRHRKLSLAQTHKYVFSNMVKVPVSGSLSKIRNQWQAIQRNHPPWPRNGKNYCNFGGNMNQSPHNNLLVWHWMFSLIFHNWITEVWEFTTKTKCTQKTLQCKYRYIFLEYFLLNKF